MRPDDNPLATHRVIVLAPIETSFSRPLRQLDIIVRWPFYANLRLGFTQNALWVGRSLDANFRQLFNWRRVDWQ